LEKNEEIFKAALVGVYDDESYFVEKMYDFELKKASNSAKIKRDFSTYQDLNTLPKKV
jgi:hypothetical protein